jgi:hypothetical protein
MLVGHWYLLLKNAYFSPLPIFKLGYWVFCCCCCFVFAVELCELGKLDIHIQKNEVGYLPNTIYKN